jgi:hypothetical protein
LDPLQEMICKQKSVAGEAEFLEVNVTSDWREVIGVDLPIRCVAANGPSHVDHIPKALNDSCADVL